MRFAVATKSLILAALKDGLSMEDKSIIGISNLALMHMSTMTKTDCSLGDKQEKGKEDLTQVMAMAAHEDRFALWFQGGHVKVWCQDQAGGVELVWEWNASHLVRNIRELTFSLIERISWPGACIVLSPSLGYSTTLPGF